MQETTASNNNNVGPQTGRQLREGGSDARCHMINTNADNTYLVRLNPICLKRQKDFVLNCGFTFFLNSELGHEMDECLLRCGHVLERLATFKMDSADLNDFAESIRNEIINGNSTETDNTQDWQTCTRLQPEQQNYFLTAGYNDCMEEAIRFLIEDEEMGPEHPVVRNLKNHLEEAKDQILDTVSSNINNLDTSNPSDISYDCYMAVNLLDTVSR